MEKRGTSLSKMSGLYKGEGNLMVDYMPFLNELRHKVNNTHHGKIIYLTISGSDLYGFRSADSDVDIRGCWQVSTNKLLGLGRPRETIEMKTLKEDATKDEIHDRDIFEADAVMHELGKELSMIIKGNCNIVEHVFAEPIETSEVHKELKTLAEMYWNTKGLYHSYRGMAYQNYNKFILGGKHSAKKYLYVVRGLLAGTYALTERRIEPNLDTLNKYFEEPVVDELLDLKRRGLEKDPVKHMDRYDQLCDKYFKEIDRIFVDNQDEDQPDIEEANAWLKEQRIEYLD